MVSGRPRKHPVYIAKVHFESVKRKGKPLCNVGYTIYSPPDLSQDEDKVDCKLCWIQRRFNRHHRIQG